MIKDFVTLYDPIDGSVLYSTKLNLNLPDGKSIADASDEDWEKAKDLVSLASGKPCVFGRPKVGQVVEDGAFVDRRKSLQEIKDAAWANLKRQRSAIDVAGFPFLGKIIQNDAESAAKIANRAARARDALTAAEEFSVSWTTADNSVIELDANQMLDMFAAMDDHADRIHETAQRLRAEIANAVTAEEVAAVRWPEAATAT